MKKTDTNKDELGFQKELIDSAKQQRGYGRKISHPQTKGIGDLLIQLGGFSMVNVECKDLGALRPGFDVVSGITEQQKKHIDALNGAALGCVAFYCARVVINGEEYAYFSSYTARYKHADMLSRTKGFVRSAPPGPNKWSNLYQAWDALGVLRIDTKGIHPLAMWG